MAMRTASGLMRPCLQGSRGLVTRAEASERAKAYELRRGPLLPPHNDPAAYHPQEHSAHLAARWLKISAVATVGVTMFFLTMGDHHRPHKPTPKYEYLKRAVRSPRFPWGDEDLLGTPEDRAARKRKES